MKFALSAVGLTVERGGRAVLTDVNIKFLEARWTGVVGANGSGKTTLLKALAGRLGATGGEIRLGEDVQSRERLALATKIGFAPDAAALPGSLTGEELLMLMSEEDPADPGDLVDLREALEIGRLQRLRLSSMSAGMRQRIALYSAFVRRADVILLDEPFNWLDPVCTFDVKEALRTMTKVGKLTLVTALHDFGTLTTYCDHGILLADGRIVRVMDQTELQNGAGDLARFELELINRLREASVGAPAPLKF